MPSDRHRLITETARSLRQRGVADPVALVAADLLVEMSGSERREVCSRTMTLLQHLIKWAYQPEQRSPSWTSTIVEQRKQLAILLRESPSLRRYQTEHWASWWPPAIRYATQEMKAQPFTKPPAQCPWSLKQVMLPTWMP
jgi:hypothetical protein